MPVWLRRLTLDGVFWSYVWLLLLVGGPLLHPLLEQRNKEQPSAQQNPEQQPSPVAGSETTALSADVAVRNTEPQNEALERRPVAAPDRTVSYLCHVRDNRQILL